MHRHSLAPAWIALALIVSSGAAYAEGPKSGRAKAGIAAKAGAKQKKGAKAASAPPPVEATEPATVEPAAPSGEGETKLKASSAQPEAVKGVKEKESAEGVKTYQFGAIEVEGRLRSPQLIYFLRRVRAEFQAGALGHRSFLGELSDTRNDPAFR